MSKELTKQRKWQIKQRGLGNCSRCGKPRGEDGTSDYCRQHANDHCEYQKARNRKKKEQNESNVSGESGTAA